MVREFNLINEKGQIFSLMDIENYCLLTDPSGLGYEYLTEYERVDKSFISNLRKIEQGSIVGTVNFSNYDNFTKLVDFIENAEKIKFQYIIPQKGKSLTLYKDVEIQSLSKTQIQPIGVLSETIIFNCLSLWYEENKIIYAAEEVDDELRWDFEWDSRFADYENRNIIFENKGQVEASFLLELNGYLENPAISIYVDNEKKYELALNLTLEQNEKIIYSTEDDNLRLCLIDENGNETNLFNELDLNNINFFKIPKGISEIRLTADNEILNSKLTIFVEYIAV